ncbi:MAG: GDCCVxC domain-containing (seleno)protein [Gallionellaceae bacterium]
MSKKIILESTITCPECGHKQTETMPTDTCQWFYECSACGVLLKPKRGDCCVFCSYGTTPCPPIQQGGGLEFTAC